MILQIILASSILFLGACATTGKSIRDVPQLKSENIEISALSALPQRSLSLMIKDERQDQNQSAQLKLEIQKAVSESLKRSGIKVSEAGPNELTLTVRDAEMGRYKEGCVKIVASMKVPKKAILGAESASCFETKNPFGGKLSVDITKAYEEALTVTFKHLDQALGQISTAR